MLSVIIPTLDEAATIGKTLAHLQRIEGDFEIIVVDAGSQDATRKIAEQMGVHVIKGPRGVAQQLETGVAHAQGNAFLFLHADCQPPAVFEYLSELDGRVAGGFLHQYDKFHLLSAIQASINNANAQLFKRFCGEQGFFCTKEALMAAGGVPESSVFEIEQLSENARRAGVDVRILPGRMTSSNRRFTNAGFSAFFGMNWAHAIRPLSNEYKLKKYFGRAR